MIEGIERQLGPLQEVLARLEVAESECKSANIEENDYTIFTRDDLEFEYQLVEAAVAKKFKFIDNQVRRSASAVLVVALIMAVTTLQIVSRNMTNLDPAQLEQFESTFRYFDRAECNTLTVAELAAALASLGIVYSDDDMNVIYDELVRAYGALTFEAFINLMVLCSSPLEPLPDIVI